MLKRLIGPVILLTMFGIVVFNFTQENSNTNEQIPTEIEDENFNGVAIAKPEGNSSTASQAVEVGEQAPDFSLKRLNGEEFSLSELKGKKIFLNFWATWCDPCRKEMPEMQTFHEQYGDEVAIIAVNATGTERSVESVQKFVNEFGLTFPIIIDKDLSVTLDQYKAFGLPTTYFINRDGHVQLPYQGGEMDFEMLKEKMEQLE
ncbi:redoxin domain-containing protein [Salinibacillus xinjiangensis]|uniref:Redoxin domain-containing protein n=1 Tax=Salinibacillus xinjiangensis TaxID=1229268 RepID=A0A6G1X389_9BACI|nr:redoxin domain-containing protein [Salinibacillus xinjiangensis]MRG85288.1 redoxin domain-containing protein [Salinibacillus xinjiangensis]